MNGCGLGHSKGVRNLLARLAGRLKALLQLE
jgi:hypothetical protein